MFLFTILFYFYILIIPIISVKSGSENEVAEFDKMLREEDGLVVLFTQECCACVACVEAEVLVGGMSQELEDHLGVLVLRLKEPALRSRYGIKKVPALAYIRQNKTALYDGKFELDTLYSWLQENRQPSTADLDDTSFEHLTQAATGATTGDWLVLFHDGKCCKHRELIKLENAGIKLRNKANVASVNTLKAPETTERFKITACPEVILFRHQRMYRFSLPDINVNSLSQFADHFYKNSKAERVPLPPSAFDKFTDKIVEFYREHWYGILVVLAITTVCTTIMLVCAMMRPYSHKKDD